MKGLSSIYKSWNLKEILDDNKKDLKFITDRNG
jgi:hypothetical protein